MNRTDTTSTAAAAAARTLRHAFSGPVHVAGDGGYDEARLPWQRRIDQYPAVVAEATSPREVQAAVRAAREHELPLVVQTTGHGMVTPADGGLLLKTSRMADITVDSGGQTVRVGGGAVWGDVIAAAAPYGLAPLSGSSPTVGVAGYTLGGGMGSLSRSYGYAADSLLRAEVVTADGQLLTASPAEHPDLYWALRGGGGNFGVVTSLTFRLYPVTQVYAGMVMFDAGRAADLLKVYREWALGEPDASDTSVMLVRMPPLPELPEALRGRRVLALRVFWNGAGADAERALAPLRAAAGPPLLDGMRELPFAETPTMAGPPPPPVATVASFDLFRELPDPVIAAVLDADGVDMLEVRHLGGAMAQPPEGAGPVGHRDVPFYVNGMAMAMEPEQLASAANVVAAVAGSLRPHAAGGSFLNFLGDPAQTASAYTAEDYRRLAAVKRAYDPDNFFRGNHNIPPEG